MLVPTTRVVALSVPVGLWLWTGAGVLVITGAESTPLDVGMTKVGVAETVALPEVGTTIGALVGTGAAVEIGDSEAGMLVGSIDVGTTVGPEETPDPVGIPEGKMPDRVGLSLIGETGTPEDAALGVGMTSVSLGIGGVTPTLTDSDGVGTTPVGTPVGKIPEENSEAKLCRMLVAGGSGADPVAVGDSNRLVKMLGRTDAAGSGMIVGKRLDTSEIKEDTAGGTIPDGSGTGEDETGAVGPAEPGGSTPVTSETNEDRIDGRLSGSEGSTASDVGMAPEGDAPVPNAVVIPTTIPPEDGCTRKGAGLDWTGVGVGCTGSLGRTPVEPTCWVGVGSGSPRRVERRPPRKPCEGVGETTEEGMPPPVEPGTMKGPRKLDATGEDGSGVGSGVTTAGAELAGTIAAGELPVGPTTPPKRDERRLPTGALGAGEGEGEACTISSGAGLLEGAEGEAAGSLEAGTIRGGSTPVLPRMGRRGARAGLEEGTGEDSGDSLSGSFGRGVDAGDEVPSDVRPVEPLAGLEGGCGRSSTGSGEAGTGEGRWAPVPGKDPLLSGTGVTTISLISVVVLVRESLLLLPTTFEVSEPGLRKGARSDERSICRDSTWFDVVLEEDGDVVGAAGAVELVTI